MLLKPVIFVSSDLDIGENSILEFTLISEGTLSDRYRYLES